MYHEQSVASNRKDSSTSSFKPGDNASDKLFKMCTETTSETSEDNVVGVNQHSEIPTQISTITSGDKKNTGVNQYKTISTLGDSKEISRNVSEDKKKTGVNQYKKISTLRNTEGISTIVSATTHQANSRLFRGAGKQCTANSYIAILHAKDVSTVLNMNLDYVLSEGDKLYVNLEPNIPAYVTSRYLSADELPSQFKLGSNNVDVELNYVISDLYPTCKNDEDFHKLRLKNILDNNVFNDDWNDNKDGCLFTGGGYTMAFWTEIYIESNEIKRSFYLFNSHGVNERNESDNNGVARVFKLNSTKALADTLINYSCRYQEQYEINKVRVANLATTTLLVDTDLTQCSSVESCIVIDSQETNCSKSSISPLSELILRSKSVSPGVAPTQKSLNQKSDNSYSLLSMYDVDNNNCITATQSSNTIATSVVPTLATEIQKSNDSYSILTTVTHAEEVKKNVHVITATDKRTSAPIHTFKKIIQNQPIVVLEKVKDFKLTHLKPKVVITPLESLQNISRSSKKRGRPTKVKKGPKKSMDNAHLAAVIKYKTLNPELQQKCVKTYNVKKPDINKKSVKKYHDKHPDAVKKAIAKYHNKHPDVVKKVIAKYHNKHPDAVKKAIVKYHNKHPDVVKKAITKYHDKHPDAVKKATANYQNKHPEINLKAVKKYKENNPIINKKAVDKYQDKHPEINRKAVAKYQDKNRDIIQKTSAQYNKTSRNVDPPLRRSDNLIGEKRDDELKLIRVFSLKNQSLNSPNTYICQHCHARLFEEEKTRLKWCCGAGANNVLALDPLTEDFYTHTSFIQRPRAYNNLFAFSALGVTHGYHHPDGIAFLKIQGRVYHRVFDLRYDQNINNIGLYINDGSERENIAKNRNLDLDVVRSITHYLHNVNPLIECFKRLNAEASDEAYIMFQKTSRATHGNILGDSPMFSSEVAAIISTDKEQYVPRCIAIWKVGERKPHTVDIMHNMYECFQYPLLLPNGTLGWHPNKQDNFGRKLTQARYVRCLLLSESRFSQFSRLSEEWLVDMYCRISEERLRYLHNMQKNSFELRMAPLQELDNDETIQGEGIVPGRVYLPYSFTGGPRYMKVKYLDCIALVNRLGPPSYFVTFTCNPNWPEIKKSIPHGQRYANPLICTRVFNLRLLALIRDIRSGLWFGKIEYLTYVVEFQKRGLPHAHICFRVEGGGPKTNFDIDKVCRADIPDELEAEGRLRPAVLKHMIHGPCGRDRDYLPCYDKETHKCNKRFPKRETDVTFLDGRGFVHLRRNSNNEAVIKYKNREIKVNETWTVPYNASLLLKYDAHINIEVSSHRNVVKYLFKYLTKGPDEARVAVVEEQNDEIENYVTKRYIGSSDAAWRILEFDITSREPNVKQLAVHLEHKQTVYFKPGHENEVNRESSDLLTYFNRPLNGEFDNLKYTDFYEKYIVHPNKPNTKVTIYETTNGKFVTERQRGIMICRLFWVSPTRGEQFYLRLLLNAFPCRGYADLLNLGGLKNDNFQEACKAVGLCDNEMEYNSCMSEAATFFTGYRLRRFFVLLAVNGAPAAILWNTFKDQICEDYLHRFPNEFEKCYNLGLKEISRLLQKHSLELNDLGLPQVEDDSTEFDRELGEYNVEQQKLIVDEWLPKLSTEQRSVFDYINKLCTDANYREKNPCAIFIDGPAGTGKTKLLNTISSYVRGYLKSVAICTASSAIAAQNLENASTAHSMFKFPLNILDDDSNWNLSNSTQRGQLIYKAKVIIYDEAPMAHKSLIHMLDRSLQDLMNCKKMFGGKIIIFAGDFRQIPPVVVDAKTDSDILHSSMKTSPLWQDLKKFTLISSQRCRDDVEYAKFILDLGSNELPTISLPVGNNIHKVVNLNMIDHVTELHDLIDYVFSNGIIVEPDVAVLRNILCTRNDAVREINSIILDRLPGNLLHFYSCDKIANDDADQLYLGQDFLNRIKLPGIPDHELKLKVGCVCMIIRNLSFADGLVNGTKVIVLDTSPNLITVRKEGCYENIPYLIPRILFKAPIERNSPYEIARTQFPLQVSYAITIHRSQGKTITRAGIDLRSDIFSHGQLYVALGRVQEKNDIKILVNENRLINGTPYANNKIIADLIK